MILAADNLILAALGRGRGGDLVVEVGVVVVPHGDDAGPCHLQRCTRVFDFRRSPVHGAGCLEGAQGVGLRVEGAGCRVRIRVWG